jgi:hypothetical protein
MINTLTDLTTPYLYIEDEAMYHLRQSGEWQDKGMPAEVIDPMMRIFQSQIYTTGQRRILWKMIRGHDFKVLGPKGFSSYQFVCREMLRSSVCRTGGSLFRLLPNAMSISENKSCDPPVVSPFSLNKERQLPGKYAKYIGETYLSDLTYRVGRCEGGTLLIHSPSTHLLCETENQHESAAFNIRHNLNPIIERMFKGRDFILYPYGYSLQDFLTRLVSRKGIMYSDFRLERSSLLPDLKIPGVRLT